jgi:hypothetical protein
VNWERIEASWKQFKGNLLDWIAAKAGRKQLVEWLAREHKRDPIHK